MASTVYKTESCPVDVKLVVLKRLGTKRVSAMSYRYKLLYWGDSSVLHCASLLRANERVHVHKVRVFPLAQLDSEINVRFL